MALSTQINLATQVRGTLPVGLLPTGIPTANLSQGSSFLLSTGTVAMAAALSLGGFQINNLANGVATTDAATVGQVQALFNGLSDRASVQYATAAALPANTYANGVAGVGATLTATTNGALSVDGVAVAVGQRILVQNESTSANNGIYTVTATGGVSATYLLTRSADQNTSADFVTGFLVPVEVATGNTAGTINNGKIFMSACASSFTVGTTGITFTGVGNVYTAGTGLTGTTTFSVAYGTTAGTAAQGNDTRITGALQTSSLGTGVATALAATPGATGGIALFSGALGTPSSATLTNASGLPISTGVSGLGVNVATALAIQAGTSGGIITFGGAAGTPSSITLSNATGLPVTTGISGLGTGVASVLATATGAAGGVPVLATGGYLAAADFPAISGDVTITAGSLTATVNNTSGTGFVKYTDIVANETPGGTINGTNTAFTLAHTPATLNSGVTSLELYYNGDLLDDGVDFAITGLNISLNFTPQSGGDKLRAWYFI